MNQNIRQKSKERDFLKLLNNSNFRCDCRNNVVFKPICNERDELRYPRFSERLHLRYIPTK